MADREERVLRVGAFQFCGSAHMQANAAAILRGMRRAARRGVRLLGLQEGALTGYVGVDRDELVDLDRRAVTAATRTIAAEAARLGLYVALGTTAFRRGRAYNSLRLLGPDGRSCGTYAKRALYGDGARHYAAGASPGRMHRVDGVRVGLRICFEFRFPEYFRELLARRAQLAVVAFSMNGTRTDKLPVARAHLVSRAAENGLWILAVNNVNGPQNAPTCLVDPAGRIAAEAPSDREALLVGDVTISKPDQVQASIVAHARSLCAKRNT